MTPASWFAMIGIWHGKASNWWFVHGHMRHVLLDRSFTKDLFAVLAPTLWRRGSAEVASPWAYLCLPGTVGERTYQAKLGSKQLLQFRKQLFFALVTCNFILWSMSTFRSVRLIRFGLGCALSCSWFTCERALREHATPRTCQILGNCQCLRACPCNCVTHVDGSWNDAAPHQAPKKSVRAFSQASYHNRFLHFRLCNTGHEPSAKHTIATARRRIYVQTLQCIPPSQSLYSGLSSLQTGA